ncbi:hypothetical protein KFK09_025268 [Dendrobium nobile]|uniref:Protein CASP n=1 Tax=Dendrobium nobile TaxID=94219 RepID=A0A8T3AGH7_DENNO|nr:hypothetical protein KFK09_025268 [Dendrobium nobile]
MESSHVVSEREKATTSSPIAVVCSFWKDFDLEKEKSGLDEQGLRIAENQEISQKNRRKLAENTRDFKKASSEEKLNLFNSLLKGYQEEVDNLTKRAKFGENAFLNIYQKLYEAPDPYAVLASVAEQEQKLSELESENRKMKLELEEYRTEATHLKNQQATIRRLEERNRQLEQQMEEKVREIVEIRQRSLAEENQRTLEVLKEREQLLQEQLRQAKESVMNMQKIHEFAQSQLFELRAQSEEERAAKQAELNLLMDEVERAQTRLQSIEREKGVLRSQLQSVNEESVSKQSDSLDSSNALEISLNAKEKMISDLNVELHKMETAFSNEREQHMSEIRKLNALLNEKVKISEKSSLLDVSESKIAELTMKVNEQQKLISILEDDILKGYNSSDRKGSLLNDWDMNDIGTEASEGTDLRHVSVDQDQSSMLKVICNQRDRFRTRLREAEEEVRLLKEKVSLLKDELEKTKADNVKLYGKIRYVQDYSQENLVSRGPKKYAEDIESGFGSDVESKYKKMYEDDINPFAAFSKKERDQRYRELGIRDKITLTSGRFLLGNKYARTFIFFYSIGLHLLVFACLYRMSALSYISTAQDESFLQLGNQTNLPHTSK